MSGTQKPRGRSTSAASAVPQITINVGETGRSRTINIRQGATAGQLCEANGIRLGKRSIIIRGAPVGQDHVLQDHDTIVIVGNVEGGRR